MKNTASLVLLLAASCTSGKGDSDGHQNRFPTPEHAALQALELHDEKLYGDLDPEATLVLLQSPRKRQAIDLDGQGGRAWIFSIGTFVESGGEVTSVDGATGNADWAIVRECPGGTYELVHSGFSTHPRPLQAFHNGLRNLEAGWHMSAEERGVSLLRFDGRRYVTEWSFTAIVPDGSTWMEPVVMPKDLILATLKPHFDVSLDQLEFLEGGAFQRDLDNDGAPELIVQIDKVKVAGQSYHLHAIPGFSGNYRVYTGKPGKWELIHKARNVGPVRMPWKLDNPTRFIFETQAEKSTGRPKLKEWTLVSRS